MGKNFSTGERGEVRYEVKWGWSERAVQAEAMGRLIKSPRVECVSV